MLLKHGMSVQEVPLYTVETTASEGTLPPLSYLLFGSAQGVEAYFARFSALPEGTVPVCIGPVTAQRLKSRTGRPFLTASTPSASAMVDAVCRHAATQRP